jgi:hypothetical protein
MIQSRRPRAKRSLKVVQLQQTRAVRRQPLPDDISGLIGLRWPTHHVLFVAARWT